MMGKVRCAICRQHLPTLKTLKSHYLSSHSKFQIIREFIKNSVLRATPSLIMKTKKRRKEVNSKTIFLHDKVHITYTNDSITIEDESSSDNMIEFTFNEAQNYPNTLQDNNNNTGQSAGDSEKENRKKPGVLRRRFKRNKKSKKMFQIGIKKIREVSKSLDEHTGEFYECHCMEKPSSDTESCSDTSKNFYCSCGNGYSSAEELHEHEKTHQFFCRICNQKLNMQSYKEHIEQHLIRIYVCHLCGFEFICKELLMSHLMYHFEQQTFENILNMEQDYNMYGFCNTNFSAGDYCSNINNILFFLTYPYDHYYSRNMFKKVVCDICYEEFFIYDYERHLKIAHFVQ